MRDSDVGALPVMNDGIVVGMLTDRDITVRAVADQRDLRSVRAGDVMSTAAVCCFKDDNIEDAAAFMKRSHVQRVIVLDRERRPVGILSVRDLASSANNVTLAGMVLT